MPRILVVDDEDTPRRNMERFLGRKEGWEVSSASSADEAMGLIKENAFDVVVTDMRMENEGAGLSVLQAAKEKDKFVEGIVITAYASVKNAADAMERDAFTYVEKDADKPYELLCSKVEEALERRQQKIIDETADRAQWALVMREIAKRRYTTLSELSSELRIVPSKLRVIVNELLEQKKIDRKLKGELEMYYLK